MASRLVQFMTGLNGLRKHEFQIGRAISDQCRLCSNGVEEAIHLVVERAAYANGVGSSFYDFWSSLREDRVRVKDRTTCRESARGQTRMHTRTYIMLCLSLVGSEKESERG